MHSTHSLAVILSSESINSEATAHSPVENVLPSPDLSSESDGVSDKLSDTPTNIERTNVKPEEIISKSDSSGKSEHEIEPNKIISNTEADIAQQPQIIESNENVEIPERKIATQKTSDDQV